MSRSTPAKTAAERKYPAKVDIVVPPLGLGNRLNEMYDWLNGVIGRGKWESHGHLERETHYSRFYFTREADARDFERQFGDSRDD